MDEISNINAQNELILSFVKSSPYMPWKEPAGLKETSCLYCSVTLY
jgi:hypothetical protein